MSAEEIMPTTKSKRPKRNAKKKNRQQRLDNALDEGLEETFPASDVVAITEHRRRPAITATESSRDPGERYGVHRLPAVGGRRNWTYPG
jgi:hypothetical protein